MIVRKITPVDLFCPRGNRLFGAGVHGDAALPPWPSVFAGAVASRALVDAGRFADVAREPEAAEEVLAQVLGPDFALTGLALSRRGEVCVPLPADLACFPTEGEPDKPQPVRRVIRRLGEGAGVRWGPALSEWVPVLEAAPDAKPAGGYWLTAEGLRKHLQGLTPGPDEVVKAQADLWTVDARLGIALSEDRRTAAEGRIYTTDAVQLLDGVSFVASFRGRNLPEDGLLRLGGDGRGAVVEPASPQEEAFFEEVGRPQAGWPGFRLLLATPGVFPGGWRPPGVGEDGVWELPGLRARLVAAMVGRNDVVSGWDVAKRAPKPAVKVAPWGSVYWFRVESGDTGALESVWAEGLWGQTGENIPPSRRREGFNRVWFGRWDPKEA